MISKFDVIAEIAFRQPEIGKTALMKYVYILQTIFKKPLGYDYELYTYGPYCSQLAFDLEDAKNFGLINITRITYPDETMRYQISANKTYNTTEISGNIEKIIQDFGYKARNLELSSTIIFIFKLMKAKQDVIEKVNDIKPHFSIEEITNEYNHLSKLGYLN